VVEPAIPLVAVEAGPVELPGVKIPLKPGGGGVGGGKLNLSPLLDGVEVLMFKILRGLRRWSGGVQTFDGCQYSSTVADGPEGIFQSSR
jgi:hypothetical protein